MFNGHLFVCFFLYTTTYNWRHNFKIKIPFLTSTASNRSHTESLLKFFVCYWWSPAYSYAFTVGDTNPVTYPISQYWNGALKTSGHTSHHFFSTFTIIILLSYDIYAVYFVTRSLQMNATSADYWMSNKAQDMNNFMR